jgi:uncharacterized protein with GYD domain
MALYLTRFSQLAETWAKLIENPEDRRGPVGELSESIDGKLLGYWYAFGDGDGYTLFEAPDQAIIFLAGEHGMARAVAYAYMSAATDYVVSQVVDKTKGVHARIAKAHFVRR